jgi:predicted HTH domain antitoxin
MQNVPIQFELPELLISQTGLNSENISQEVRRILALFLYEHGRVSLGKACELGGMSLWEFAEMNQQLNIPIRYSDQQLQEDLTKLAHV